MPLPQSQRGRPAQFEDLSDDLAMGAVFSDLLAVRQVLASNVELEAQLKQRIQQRMGDATTALFQGGDVSWKRSKDGVGLDTARLLQDQPGLLKTYSLTKPGFATLPGWTS
ncbi:MAG: hypothetical protein QM777_13100 [Pseudorhodoferax sp.]